VNIPITRPFFGQEERHALLSPLDTGWVVQGPWVKKFEEKFGAFTGARHAAAASSCTAALHLVVAALGLGPGDEVVVPGFTWVATANAVEYMGAKPVLCDIDLRTYNINVEQLAAVISPRTVGIIPVHLFGLCADMEAILAVARRHALWVVEDAACAFGGWYKGRHAGTFGDGGCFSFHPRKSITTGEGGMVTTERDDLDARVRSLRDHGASRSDVAGHATAGSFLLAEYEHLGYNYRMTDVQGALGTAQMDRATWILAERARRARRYDAWLSGRHDVAPPMAPDGYVHGYQAYVTLFCPEEPTLDNVERLHDRRNEVMRRLEARGVATRQGTHAVVLQGYYAKKYDLRPEDYRQSYFADRLTLTLPLYAQMTDAEQQFVCDNLHDCLSA
jgi:perosamine synthetase